MALSEDRDHLHETHAQWLVDAENLVSQVTAQGVIARRVPVDVDAMFDWCREQNLPFNASGRAQFVTWWLRNSPKEKPEGRGIQAPICAAYLIGFAVNFPYSRHYIRARYFK